jgi:ADP-heptose:LPS heptosyltransferase
LGKARFGLSVDASSSNWAMSQVPPFAIHISLSAAKATREWPLEHHANMLQQVWARHPNLGVVVSSGAEQRQQQRLVKFATLLNDDRLRVLAPGMTIPQLAAVLQRCQLHLGPDSGVLHLAVALGLPTVSFFREQGAYRSFMPEGPRHRVISMPCHCIDGYEAPCEKLGHGECFTRIEPSRVAELICEELAVNSSQGDNPAA